MKRHFNSPCCAAFFVALILCVFAPLASSSAPAANLSDCAAPPERPTLLLYAFEAEGALLESRMAVDSAAAHLGRRVVYGRLSDRPVVLAESGVGMTNAAMTAQALLDRCRPARVLFSGIAGGIDSSVHIGDIVVCSAWVAHKYGYWGAEGFAPDPVEVYLPVLDTAVSLNALSVDVDLFRTAGRLAGDTFAFDSIGGRQPRVRVGGVGASGNSFVDNVEKRLWLSATFSAQVVDMESAAVVQVCTANGVPCLVFRSASDLAGGSGSSTARTEIGEFFRVAAANSAQVVLRFLEHL